MRPTLHLDSPHRWPPVTWRWFLLIGAVLAALLSAVLLPALAPSARGATTAVPTPSRWTDVTLAQHSYGRLTAPQALVGTAGAGLFTFAQAGQGGTEAPNAFTIAADGSVWAIGRTGFVVWDRGVAANQFRTVRTPDGTVVDVAVAADGTIYSMVIPQGRQQLFAQSADGTVRWHTTYAEEVSNAPLRFGPDGVLYLRRSIGQSQWMPLTTAAGTALSEADQVRLAVTGLPLAGGLRLAGGSVTEHRAEFVLIGPDGAALRGWRITSDSQDWLALDSADLVGNDLVVVGSMMHTAGTKVLGYEYVTLRITPAGRIVTQILTDARAVWGDLPAQPRVGPDGALYELRTSPTAGVQIYRYALDGSAVPATSSSTAATTSPATASSATASPPTRGQGTPPAGPTVASPTLATPTAGPTSTGATQATGWSTTQTVLTSVAGIVLLAVVWLIGWLLIRRRHGGTGGPDGEDDGADGGGYGGFSDRPPAEPVGGRRAPR
jgi:hypothetical protein